MYTSFYNPSERGGTHGGPATNRTAGTRRTFKPMTVASSEMNGVGPTDAILYVN